MALFQHTLLLTYRSFRRFKSTFFINLVGLSTGLAGALLIYLWVTDELSMDKYHAKDERLYQVMQNLTGSNGNIETMEATPGILPAALAQEIPEIEHATSVVPAAWFPDKGSISFNNRRLKANGQFIGKDYFNMFSVEFIAGDKKAVLQDNHNLAISEELALKLFRTTVNVIGKTVEWSQGEFNGTYQITGIFKKLPPNTTAPFDLLLNYDLFREKRPGLQEWGNSDPSTFVLLKAGTDIAQVNQKIKNFLQTKNNNAQNTLFLQRYSDKYLFGKYENGAVAGGRITYVRLFVVIALFILVIACINFMNLSTAKAARRLKEVGIKKAIGASRQTLVLQYLGESMLLTWLSLFLALVLVILLLPLFNQITGKHLVLHFNLHLTLAILFVTVLTGLIAGSYPALYLSGFQVAPVLKGKLPTSGGELWARQGLVVVQFVVSVILMVAVLVVYQQIAYVQTKNLGYNRENILHFQLEINRPNDKDFFAEGGEYEQNMEAFVHEVKNIPGVIQAANFEHDLVGRHGGMAGIDWQPGNQDEEMPFANLQDGYDFIPTLGIELIQGRSFSRNFSQERAKVIFNEAAIAQMGLKDPVGKKIKVWGQEKEIIGVAKNFHFESLYEEVKPCIIQLEPRANKIMVKIVGGTERETIARLEQLYHQYSPGLPFEYTFLDADYQALYAAEQRVAVLSKYFAGLAILISGLGLFGLAAFTAERRRKEIGVRKVLGASRFNIVYLLSGDFTKIVLAAIAISLPLSYLLVKHWLQNFEYRISLQWWYFVGAGLAALVIAWLTVGTQALKAASANPAHSLKDE